MQVQKTKDDKKRIAELEKKCRLLEETAKAKNPNSIGMLIQAAKTEAATENEGESKRALETKVKHLEAQLESQDKDFEKKLRAMRQEQERIKEMYEARAGNSGDSKIIKELEKELEKTKSYYNKRIREIEDKYKYGRGGSAARASEAPKSQRSQKSDKSDKLQVDMAQLNTLRE